MPVLEAVADDRRVARGELLSHPGVLEAALPGTPDEIAKHRVERGRGEWDQQEGFAIDAKIEQGRDLDGMGERVVAAGLGKRLAGFDGVEAKRSGVAQAHQRLEGEGALEKDDAVVPELCEWFAHCGPAPLFAWVSSGTGKRFPLGLLAWDTLPSPPGLC